MKKKKEWLLYLVCLLLFILAGCGSKPAPEDLISPVNEYIAISTPSPIPTPTPTFLLIKQASFDERGNPIYAAKWNSSVDVDSSSYGADTVNSTVNLIGASSIEYEYDSLGRMSIKRYYDANGDLVESDSYTYNEDGFVIKNDFQRKLGDDLSSQYTVIDRDEFGNVLTSTLYASNGTPMSQIQNNYEYDNFGRVIMKTSKYYSYNGEDNIASIRNSYTKYYSYDENGNIVSITNSDTGSASYYTYEYNIKGQRICLYWNNLAFVRSFYNEDGMLSSELLFGCFDDMRIDEITEVEYIYDNYGNKIRENYYSYYGRTSLFEGGGDTQLFEKKNLFAYTIFEYEEYNKMP